MATREKTIRFATDTATALWTDATVTNLTQFTVYIPETVIAFTSVFVELSFMDIVTATGGTITEHRCGLRLGAAGYTTITETDDIAQTGENISGVLGPFDFTSHFTTNWTGASMTCDIQGFFDQNTGTTLGMANVNAVLYVTYTYDDDPATNATQIKTVQIPLESLAGALTTTANSNIGSNQIPALTSGGLLPEASVVIRDYAFIIEANTANNNSTTDHTVSVNIDAGTALTFQSIEGGLGTDRFVRLTWKPSVPDTTTAHNFQMWASVANRMNLACVTLCITYEFAPASSTRILNSIQLPIELASPLGVTTSAEASRFTRNVLVQEPGTITLRQSAFRMHFNAAAAVAGLAFRAGGQSFRSLTHLGNGVAGMFNYQARLDSGAAGGAGMTLARGINVLTVDGYATDTTDQVTNISGYVILNYESDKAASGLVGQHVHSVMKVLIAWDALLTDRVRVNNYSFAIPETDYWITSAGFMFVQWVSTAGMAITFDVECLPAEGKAAGYYDIYADAYQTDAERACSMVWMRGRDVFKRRPDDPDPERLDIETARDYRLFTTTTCANGLLAVLSYHSFTYSSTITISGSAGGTVTVDTFRSDTDEKIHTTSRVGNGDVTVTFADNTMDVYSVAYEDDTHLGRSAVYVIGD